MRPSARMSCHPCRLIVRSSSTIRVADSKHTLFLELYIKHETVQHYSRLVPNQPPANQRSCSVTGRHLARIKNHYSFYLTHLNLYDRHHGARHVRDVWRSTLQPYRVIDPKLNNGFGADFTLSIINNLTGKQSDSWIGGAIGDES